MGQAQTFQVSFRISQASLRSDNRHYNFPCEAFYLQGNIAQKTPFCPCHKGANVHRSTDTTNGLRSCFSPHKAVRNTPCWLFRQAYLALPYPNTALLLYLSSEAFHFHQEGYSRGKANCRLWSYTLSLLNIKNAYVC